MQSLRAKALEEARLAMRGPRRAPCHGYVQGADGGSMFFFFHFFHGFPAIFSRKPPWKSNRYEPLSNAQFRTDRKKESQKRLFFSKEVNLIRQLQTTNILGDSSDQNQLLFFPRNGGKTYRNSLKLLLKTRVSKVDFSMNPMIVLLA